MKPAKNNNDYRKDIDGLRAVAVISVILYHLNASILPGGFIGVDIFFVISGYLITLHIIKDLDRGSFSVVEFYRRRVKRIMPAMLLVLLAVLIASLLLQLPADRKQVGEAGIASLLSLANVYFWLYLDQGYFAPQSDEVPLLHFWSLGVEEQFYLFWPLLLILVYKAMRGRHFLGLFSGIAVASFILGELLYSAAPSFVYYMLPTRAGELMVGAMAAYVVNRAGFYRVPSPVVSVAATAGILCIAASYYLLSDDSVFPGLRAIPPTAGTAFLILAGHFGNPVPNRLLRLPFLVFVGLISYSAYLWHWPLMAFYRYTGLEIGMWSGATIVALTVGLAWLTYRFVEQPTRGYRGSAARVFSYMYMLPATGLFLLSLAAATFTGFLFSGYAEEQAVLKDRTRPASSYDYVCQGWKVTENDLKSDHCLVGPKTTAGSEHPTVLLWGDSHAAHYIGVLGAFAQDLGFQFRNAEHSACPPTNQDPEGLVPAKWLDNCANSLATVKRVIGDYDVLIISAMWISYVERSPAFLSDFFESVKQYAKRGQLVILLGQIPLISGYDRNCIDKAILMPFLNCDRPEVLMPAIVEVNAQLAKFAQETEGVEYFDVSRYLCSEGICSAYTPDGEPRYYNPSHLSLPGSWTLGEEIKDAENGAPFPFTLIPGWRAGVDLPHAER